MGFLSNLFKDKKKDGSRNPSEHEHHHHHHDASATDDKTQEPLSSEQDVAPTPKAPSPHAHNTPHAEHSKEIPQHPNEHLPEPQPAVASQPQETPQTVQHSHPPLAPQQQQQHHRQPQEQVQGGQRKAQNSRGQQNGLKPAYCYTGGEFSETISREEAMLAKQYNFAASEDRAHAEVSPSATRRAATQQPSAASPNGNVAMKGEEFDSIFNQFMHGTSEK